jgi:hypothetical protein
MVDIPNTPMGVSQILATHYNMTLSPDGILIASQAGR